MGVFKRGNKLWITFKDQHGKWQNMATGHGIGEERAAKAKYDEVVKLVASMSPEDKATIRPLTVRQYAERWIPKRKAADLDWTNDDGRLRVHVLPRIGDMPIAEVRTKHLIDLFAAIRSTPLEETGEPPAPRTVHNIHSVVSAMFRDAVLDEVIEQAPGKLDSRQLGPVKDSDPEWRNSAVFTREEAATLISDERIPPDRQLVYGFELLAGMRPGEGAALRWRNYVPTMEPLGKLLVASSYNTRKHRQKGTKTDTVRHVPVHPTLAAMLAEWKLSGWAEMMGRPPTDDDLIVPLPPAAAARRRTRQGEPFRGHDYSGKRWREEDLPALGWRHRQHYDMKATFITLVVEDGADPHVIEERVTHTKKSRAAFAGYNRGSHWALVCAEVAKLKIARGSEAVSMAVGSNVEPPSDDEEPEPPYSAPYSRSDRSNDRGNQWRRRESNPRPRMLLLVRLRV